MFRRKTLWEQLQAAVASERGAEFARLCDEHRDTILAQFEGWRQVPEHVRPDPDAVDMYANALLNIAHYFDDSLGIPALMEALSQDEDEPAMQALGEMLERIDALKDSGAFVEALARMDTFLALTMTLTSPHKHDFKALAYGRCGELHRCLSDLEQASHFNELALQSAFQAGDASAVLGYVDELHEVACLAEQPAAMAKWAQLGVQVCQVTGDERRLVGWQIQSAEAHDSLGRWDLAMEHLAEAVAMARTALSGAALELSVNLNNAAELYRRHREFERALPLFEEAIALRRKEGACDATLAQILHNFALLYQGGSDVRPAGPLLEECLLIRRAAVPIDAVKLSETLNNLGGYHARLGDTAKARRCYQEALHLKTPTDRMEVTEYATVLHNWGCLEFEAGNNPAAKALLDRVAEALPDESPSDRLSRISKLAALYDRLGKYDDAEQLLLEILRLIASSQGPSAPNYVRTQIALASVLAHQGRNAEAEKLFLECEAHLRDNAAFTNEELNALLNNIGLFFCDRAENFLAEKYLLDVLARRRQTLAPSDSALLDTRNNLALVYIAQKRLTEAEPILYEVLAARRRELPPDHPNIAQSLFNLGMLYDEMGRVGEAIPLLEEQFNAEDRQLANVFAVSSETGRLAYAAKLRAQLDVCLLKLHSWGNHVDGIGLCLDAVLRRKGIVAEAAAKDRLAIGAGTTTSVEAGTLLEQLNTLRSRIARATLDQPDHAGALGELPQLERERDRIEARLAREMGTSSLSMLPQANRRNIAAALPAGSALLEFIKFELTHTGANTEPLAAYYVFVLPDHEPDKVAWAPLGLATNIESAVQLFRACITHDDVAIRRQHELPTGQIDFAAVETHIGTQLLKVLIERVREQLGPRTRLFIAPDGILNQLPFDTLPFEEGQRLGDAFEISYLSSGRDLLRLQAEKAVAPQASIVVADPDFNFGPAAARPAIATLQFAPLPDTLTEGSWIAAKIGAQCWSGDQALESRIKACQSPHILHFATHGFFLAAPPRRNDAGSANGLSAADNPLLRCGLALAGANRWLQGANLPVEAEDGLLTAEDVCAMNLRGTELVVLSACETGMGEYRIGEGIFGLRRAFELAGTRSLVMSLWHVPSGPTRELMQEFYRQLDHGQRRSQALREAQRILRRRYAEPLYWGAFVLSGDPSPMSLSGEAREAQLAED